MKRFFFFVVTLFLLVFVYARLSGAVSPMPSEIERGSQSGHAESFEGWQVCKVTVHYGGDEASVNAGTDEYIIKVESASSNSAREALEKAFRSIEDRLIVRAASEVRIDCKFQHNK